MAQFNFEYKCENCGECCKNWNPAHFDPDLVDENGNCIHLDLNTNLCNIYENRPDFCRVDKWYSLNYSHLSLEQYLHEQLIGCKALINIGQRRKMNE